MFCFSKCCPLMLRIANPYMNKTTPKNIKVPSHKVKTPEGHMCRKTVPTPHTNALRDIKHQQFQFLEKLLFMLAFFFHVWKIYAPAQKCKRTLGREWLLLWSGCTLLERTNTNEYKWTQCWYMQDKFFFVIIQVNLTKG